MVALLRNSTSILTVIVLVAHLSLALQGQSYLELSKGKTVSPAFDFLKNFTLPIPSSAYNVTAKVGDDFDLYWLYQFQAQVVSWLDWLLEYNITDEKARLPVNMVCPTDLNADVTQNQTCPNASYVTLSYWVVDDLSWYLPRDGCPDYFCLSWMDAALEPINRTGSLIDELNKQQAIAERNMTTSYYRLLSDYIGTGFRVDDTCRANINMALESVDKFDEAGWTAATTLMALVPALLTFGNLFVPRSSEVFATSFLVGVMSAMFGLGLPVRSISGVKSSRRADVGSYSFKARYWLARFGKGKQRASDGEGQRANENFDLGSLQKWSADFEPLQENSSTEELAATDWTFSSIKACAKEWKTRTHYWRAPAFLIAGSQVALFLLCIGPLFLSYGTPLLLFDCRNYWTSVWLLIAAAISACFRLIMWEKGVHERVNVYALSDLAVSSFRQFAEKSTQLGTDGYKRAHTETELPPLYPPLVNVIASAIYRTIASVKHSSSGATQGLVKVRRNHALAGDFGFLDRILHIPCLLFDACITNLKSPAALIKGGIWKTSPPGAARRWRPLIILMHLSTDGRDPLVTLFTGLVEGFILILLTAFFAAQWGGNLFVMCYTVAVLLVSVTLGRALGLFYVWHSAHSYGLHVIETQDQEQIRGCLRILCSMDEVLVSVNGSWFFEGHRLDVRPGWSSFQRCYVLGHMDTPSDSVRCICDCSLSAGTVSLLPVSTPNVAKLGKPLPNEPVTRITRIPSTPSNISTVNSHVSGLNQASAPSPDTSPVLAPSHPAQSLLDP